MIFPIIEGIAIIGLIVSISCIVASHFNKRTDEIHIQYGYYSSEYMRSRCAPHRHDYKQWGNYTAFHQNAYPPSGQQATQQISGFGNAYGSHIPGLGKALSPLDIPGFLRVRGE